MPNVGHCPRVRALRTVWRILDKSLIASAKTRQWGKGEGVCMGQTGIAPLLVQACGDVHGARPRNRPARGRRSARRPGCSDHACYGQRAAHAEGIRPARRCCALWRSLSRRQPTFVLRPTREVRPELLATTRAPGISISWRSLAAAVARDERASACNEMRQSKTVMKWPPRLSAHFGHLGSLAHTSGFCLGPNALLADLINPIFDPQNNWAPCSSLDETLTLLRVVSFPARAILRRALWCTFRAAAGARTRHHARSTRG